MTGRTTNIFQKDGCARSEKNLILKAHDDSRFYSYLGAANYMKLSEGYSQENIDRMYLYPDGKSHRQIQRSEDWKASVYLPEGWMCKDVKAGSTNINVLTSDGINLTSYTSAARYLEANKNIPR